MTKDLKSLKQLINLCLKTGVSEIEFEGTRLKLTPYRPTIKQKNQKETPEASSVEPTEEELLFWSSGQVN